METNETTNGKIAHVLAEIDILIEWADADVAQSYDDGATVQAAADFRRGTYLRQAYKLIAQSTR